MVFVLGFVWDLGEIDFICHLMKLSLILKLRCFIIKKIISTNYSLPILLSRWKFEEI
jgi:hypothetical protein